MTHSVDEECDRCVETEQFLATIGQLVLESHLDPAHLAKAFAAMAAAVVHATSRATGEPAAGYAARFIELFNEEFANPAFEFEATRVKEPTH